MIGDLPGNYSSTMRTHPPFRRIWRREKKISKNKYIYFEPKIVNFSRHKAVQIIH